MRFRVLTLNVWGLVWPIGRDVAARMRAIGDALPELELDAAALQEVWREDARATLVEAGRRAGLSHVWHRPDANTGSGLLVLSRWPIARTRFERFDLGGRPDKITHGDYYGGKGFVELELETPGAPIALTNTHLQAGYGPRRDDIYIGHRIAQVVEFAERVRAIRGPLISAGDFNFEETYEEYRVLAGLTGLRDTAALLDRRQDTVAASNAYRRWRVQPDARIDYLFARGSREYSLEPLDIRRVLDGTFELDGRALGYSDHSGLLGEFRVGAGGEAPATADPAAIETARRLLREERGAAAERRRRDRLAGGLEIVGAPLALAALRRRIGTRRAFLRACCFGGAAVAAAAGLGSLALSEHFAPSELRAYDRALARLDTLAARHPA